MATELLFRDDAYLKTASARVTAAREGGFELDRTIFYPLGGGQPGDTGWLLRANGERVPIIDTRKGDEPGTVRHVLDAGAVLPEPGETVSLELDWERRYALMRLHTALHVMSCVVVAPVTTNNDVAIYKGPGVNYKILGSIPENTTVNIGSCVYGWGETTWCKVNYGGKKGYALQSELQRQNSLFPM